MTGEASSSGSPRPGQYRRDRIRPGRVMPFSEVVGHARPLGLLSRSIARGVAAAQPAVHRPRRGREAARGAGRRAGVELPVARAGGPFPSTRAAAARPAAGLRGARTRTSLPRAAATARRDQDRAGTRGAIAATGYRPFEGRCRVVIVDEADRLTDRRAERAAEEPGGAARGLGVHPGDVAARDAAGHGPLAVLALRFGRLAAAEVARLLVERHRMRPGRGARGGGGRGRQPGPRARGRDRRASATAAEAALVGAADRRAGIARRGPGCRRRGALAGKATSAGEREELATRVRLLASLLRDAGAGGSARRAARRRWRTRDLAGELGGIARGVRRRPRACGRSRRPTARWRRCAATPARRSWRPGWSVHL